MPCDRGHSGKVYAPHGFVSGTIAFVQIDDPMLTATTMDVHSVDSFLESLSKEEAMHAAEIIGRYTLVGEIEFCL